ncbi:hypothetical protein [Streptomyces sp. NBC_00258]|uniref:hypothetical protein n=1 Tax=Streptomyces sp. NBC_00258 TaxID=2903642 RepID=UPI002E2B19B7|nr:hypothetical protein [Streptomyces sp. NBC_00258]
MSARDELIDEYGRADTAPLGTLSDLKQKLDAYRAEVLAEVTAPADAATSYAVRPCVCDETPHPTWCPASVPTDDRITEIRNGSGGPLTARELSWLKGAAARHELHVIGSRGGHWPLSDDLPRALLLVSQYLAAAMAVIERAGLVEEKATASAATATPDFFEVGRTYTEPGDTTDWRFRCDAITTHPGTGERTALGWKHFHGEWTECAYPESDWEIHQIADALGQEGGAR